MSISSPIQTCNAGGGKPWSRNAARETDSSADSERASQNPATRRAARRPGQRAQAMMTDSSSALVVCPVCSAESATTTPAGNGQVRAKSMTVLATDVTGTP